MVRGSVQACECGELECIGEVVRDEVDDIEGEYRHEGEERVVILRECQCEEGGEWSVRTSCSSA